MFNFKLKNALLAASLTVLIQPVVFAEKSTPQVKVSAASNGITAPNGLTQTQVDQLNKVIKDRNGVIESLITRFEPLAQDQGVGGDDWKEKFRLTLESLTDATLFQVSGAQTWADFLAALDGRTPGKKIDGTKNFGDPDDDLVFTPLRPCRLVDTRFATRWGFHTPIPAGGTIDAWSYSFRTDQGGAEVSSCGVDPSSKAIAVNVTVVPQGGSGLGYLTVWPWGSPQPTASGQNWSTSSTIPVANEYHQAQCRGCANEISIYAFKTAHVVVDVVGYYAAPKRTLSPQYVTTSSYDNIGAFSTYSQWSPACPIGYILSGGGASDDFWADVRKTTSRPSNGGFSIISGYDVADRWLCQYYNNTSSPQPVWCQSVCIKNPGR